MLNELSALARTRSAVRSGELLHDLSAEQRGAGGLLGPWAFKLQQSSLSVGVALLFVKFFSWIAGEPGPDAIVSAEILAAVLAVALPMAGVAAAPFLVRGHPRFHGVDAHMVRAGTAAYLYFEGSQSLLRETGGTTVAALGIWYLFADVEMSVWGGRLLVAVLAVAVGCVLLSLRGRYSSLNRAADVVLPPAASSGTARVTANLRVYAALMAVGILIGLLAAFATDALSWVRALLGR